MEQRVKQPCLHVDLAAVERTLAWGGTVQETYLTKL